MLKLNKMLLVGSDQRKSGKTTLVCELIKKNSQNHDLVSIKVTMLSEGCPNFNHKKTADHDRCLRQKGYCVVEEIDSCGNNDTSRFLAAGASRSFWLQVFEEHLLEGFKKVLKEIGKDSIVICESTSLRRVVEPSVFIMVASSFALSGRKESAEYLKNNADMIWAFDNRELEDFVYRINFNSDKWKLLS